MRADFVRHRQTQTFRGTKRRGTIARIIFPIDDRRLVLSSVSSSLRYRSFRAICALLFVSRARPRAPEAILGNVILEEIARFARTTQLGLPGQAIRSFHVLRGTREFGNSPVFLYVKRVTSTFWRWPFGILFSRNSTGICISIFRASFTLLFSNTCVSLKSVRFFSLVILYHHITSSSTDFLLPLRKHTIFLYTRHWIFKKYHFAPFGIGSFKFARRIIFPFLGKGGNFSEWFFEKKTQCTKIWERSCRK